MMQPVFAVQKKESIFGSHMKCTHTLCGYNVKFCNVTAAGTYSDHSAFKAQLHSEDHKYIRVTNIRHLQILTGTEIKFHACQTA